MEIIGTTRDSRLGAFSTWTALVVFVLLLAARPARGDHDNDHDDDDNKKLQAQINVLAARLTALEAKVTQQQQHLAITAIDPAMPALTVRAAPGQTAPLMEWLGPTGVVVATLSANGSLAIKGGIRIGDDCSLNEVPLGSGVCKFTSAVPTSEFVFERTNVRVAGKTTSRRSISHP